MIEIKSTEQIKLMKDSGKLAADTLLAVGELIKPGITGKDIDLFVKFFTEKHGGKCAPFGYRNKINENYPFPAYSCISPNNVICHGIPTSEPLDNQIFNVDITTILNGAHGDTSAMFYLGNISEQQIKIMKVAKECLDLGISKLKENIRIGELASTIEKHAIENNFSIVKEFCGHGIGIGENGFHMVPNILHFDNKERGIRLPKNLTHTVEPILIEKENYELILDSNDYWTFYSNFISAQWEHTVLITEQGCEILTQRNDILKNSIETF